MATIVDFIICTRNNREVIPTTLRSVAAQTITDFTCTVVDGLSTDGTPELIREQYPWVHVIRKQVDSGPAASRNIGVASTSSKFIVFLDSDVELAPNWTEAQIAFLETGFAIASGKLLYAGKPTMLCSSYGAINRYTVSWDGGVNCPSEAFATPRRCIWATTAAVVVRREVLDTIGGFDEAMFAFHEDSDFGWRASLSGFRVAFNPAAVALHHIHSTMNWQTMGAPRITYLAYRNRLRSALKNYETWHIFRHVGFYLLLAIADAVRKGPRKAKLLSIAWNVRHLGNTLRRRREVQSRRVVRDRDLWFMFERGFRGPGQFYSQGRP